MKAEKYIFINYYIIHHTKSPNSLDKCKPFYIRFLDLYLAIVVSISYSNQSCMAKSRFYDINGSHLGVAIEL